VVSIDVFVGRPSGPEGKRDFIGPRWALKVALLLERRLDWTDNDEGESKRRRTRSTWEAKESSTKDESVGSNS
jgi:hypothetical protein